MCYFAGVDDPIPMALFGFLGTNTFFQISTNDTEIINEADVNDVIIFVSELVDAISALI